MAITQTITALSTPPSRTDPDTFDSRADTFLTEVPTLGTEINTWAGQANALAVATNANQTAAELAEANAEAAQTAAEAAANATEWLIGTTYDDGDVVWGSDSKSYRAAQGTNVGHDPVGDGGTWWVLLGGTTGIIYSALGSDESWTGLTETITAGEILTIGETAYLKSDGKYWLADADAEATADTKLVMATATISADGTGVVLLPSSLSYMRVDATTEWTVTAAGDVMYLSTTAGELTNDPSGYTTGDIVRVCGYMETATVLCFDVSGTFIEVA